VTSNKDSRDDSEHSLAALIHAAILRLRFFFVQMFPAGTTIYSAAQSLANGFHQARGFIAADNGGVRIVLCRGPGRRQNLDNLSLCISASEQSSKLPADVSGQSASED
jgi:hypothetical protein